MTVKLTKRVVDAAEPGERDSYVFDSEVKGFGLRLRHGGGKFYVLTYRMGGRESTKKRFTIGRHGSPWTVDQARERARDLLEQIRRGEDPNQAKADARTAALAPGPVTVRGAFERFEAAHLAGKRTGSETKRVFDLDILPRWGERPLVDIARKDVLELLDAIEGRGSPKMRNRSAAYLSSFFAWAASRDLIAGNPVTGIAKLEERSRDRVLTDAELRALWKALEVETPFSPLVKVLLLTAQRRDEVARMRWQDLDLDGKAPLWTIPRDVAKNDQAHDVPLSPAAVEVLSRVPRFDGAGYVFTTNGRTPVSGFSRAKSALDARMATILAEGGPGSGDASQLQPWRFHDLRRTAATGMARLGIAVHVVEKVLNHTSGTLAGVAGIYNRHAYMEERRHALAAWAAEVARIVDGEDGGKVVPLMRGGRHQ